MTMWDLWPINEAQVIVQNIPLPQNAVPSSCTLNLNNEPMLILTDGRSYCFKTKLNSWLLLADPKDPLYRPQAPGPQANGLDLPLVNAQRTCFSINKSLSLQPNNTTALAHFELQMVNSEILGSAHEYKHWLFATVKYLLDKGPEWRLRTILDDLLGPTRPSVKWKAEIMVSNKIVTKGKSCNIEPVTSRKS